MTSYLCLPIGSMALVLSMMDCLTQLTECTTAAGAAYFLARLSVRYNPSKMSDLTLTCLDHSRSNLLVQLDALSLYIYI